jgi:hypothetical protein
VPVQARGTIETLTAGSLQAANSFSNPDAVKVTAADVTAGPSFTVDLPAHSVSVITLAVGSVPPARSTNSRRSGQRPGLATGAR